MNSTYRLQFTPDFGFGEAEKIIPYLAELGIDAVYASPVFCAAKGSSHGYDVIDPTNINPEFGGMEELQGLTALVRERGLGWVQDIVPNHMAFNSENRMLMDILESGHNSIFIDFFDIDWDLPREGLRERLLAPFLGRFYGESLEAGEIRLAYDRDGFTANYYDFHFPLKLESYAGIITHRFNRLRKKQGREHPDFLKLLGALYVLQNLPTGEDPAERSDQVRFVKQMLWDLYSSGSDFTVYLDEVLDIINGHPGEPESFITLERIIADQHFRPAFWKVATQEINYKRFFTVNSLISLRAELDRVFAETHSLILKLVGEETFTGLRVDHVDGLFHPGRYLEKLREKAGDIPIFVEKILDSDEDPPRSWPIQGTTGYEFLNHATGLFLNLRNEGAMDKVYSRFTGLSESCEHIEYASKKLIIERHMAGDIDNLANRMKTVSSSYRHGYDITLYHLKQALVEVMARFPVYRTYIGGGDERKEDEEYVLLAVKTAAKSNPALAYEIDFIRQFLLLQYGESFPREGRELWAQVVSRFEQFTVPLMAKGLEDTAFYIYNRLVALNEVGGNPKRFGFTPEEFHAYNIRRREFWPSGMNATATHDTKRGEDVRTRLAVLSEIPKEWSDRVNAWKKINIRLKHKKGRRSVPDGNEEYLIYQMLVGAFPFNESERDTFRERFGEYIVKAARESKVHTNWLSPDSAYEESLLSFVGALLDPEVSGAFLEDFLSFQQWVAWYGAVNSLSQVLLKCTSPGFPDFYQGTELWDLSMVDPDNRRPVDYECRRAVLRDILSRREDLPSLIDDLFGSLGDGRIKLFLIHRMLRARNDWPELIGEGEYLPLEASGKRKEHLFAFARCHENAWAIAILPRLLTGLAPEGVLPLGEEVWEDTRLVLPSGAPLIWENTITGERLESESFIPLAKALSRFPAALLIHAPD